MREIPFTSQEKNVNIKERHERGEKKETDKWVNNRNDIDIRKSKKKKEMKERTEKNIRQNEDERKRGKNKESEEEKKIKKEREVSNKEARESIFVGMSLHWMY